jgi:hypothetical protein
MSGLIRLYITIFIFALAAQYLFAQTTAFNYQGKLTDGGTAANGNYLMQVKLFDALAGGTQIGATVSDVPVTVTNGTFNVSLDFGASAFAGADRFLEISVKRLPADSYTLLTPRQPILSAPYSIKSKTADLATNSAQLGGLDSTRFVQQDAVGNVSIGGNLTVSGAATYNVVNAQTQFNLGGQRILSSSGAGGNFSNLFVGFDAGQNTTPGVPTSTSGINNTFVGISAGKFNTTGNTNAFFGLAAGTQNTTGSGNSFFGQAAGLQNITGSNNSFFGVVAGQATRANDNSFFGALAGANNQAGGSNSFFGFRSGLANNAGENSFFGALSGEQNTTGTQNSFFGFRAGFANTTGSNNSFFGWQAGQANTGVNNTFFGDRSGFSNTTGNRNAFFGSAAGRLNTSGSNNTFFGTAAGETNTTGFANSFFGDSSGIFNNGIGNSFFGTFSGAANTDGGANSFFGNSTGAVNTNGFGNSFFGEQAGYDSTTNTGNTTGNLNTFIGRFAGKFVTTGSNNTFIGSNTTGASNLSFASVFGAGASVSTDNTIVLGRNLDTVQIPGNLNITGNLTGGGIVKNLNGLFGNITLAAGSNITITPSGNTLTIASTGGGSGGILNQTTLQTSANFNIDGTGRANIFNANTQFNLGGNRILFATSESGTANFFGGFSAGASTTGGFNSFVGTFAGKNITTGDFNSFFGVNAGGGEGSTGTENTFIGNGAGFSDGDGSRLTFVGVNTTGQFGVNLSNSTALGANARVTQNNSMVLGSINGVNGATADTNVGIGTTAPKARLEIKNGNILVSSPGQGIILKSPDGATCRLLSIDNAGAMVLTATACP